MRFLLAAMLLAAVLVPGAQAQGAKGPNREDIRLQACIDKIDRDAANAYEDGVAWLSDSGGLRAAQQCTALALIALGQEAEGAARLEGLANAPNAGSLEQRRIYLAQAGNAWLLAGAPEAAVVTLTNALKLAPQDAELFKDRARAYLAMRKWADAGADLDRAIELSPGNAESYLMRGRALLKLKRYDDALKDAEQAMKQAPKNVDAVVLRGDILEARDADHVIRTQ